MSSAIATEIFAAILGIRRILCEFRFLAGLEEFPVRCGVVEVVVAHAEFLAEAAVAAVDLEGGSCRGSRDCDLVFDGSERDVVRVCGL